MGHHLSYLRTPGRPANVSGCTGGCSVRMLVVWACGHVVPPSARQPASLGSRRGPRLQAQVLA